MKNLSQITFSPEIVEARAQNLPIVALESTIISHGLPYPDNIETAKKLEKAVRNKGAVPATIAVINGIAKVGLSDDDLILIGSPNAEIMKLSRRDLPFAFSQKKHGATTVAGTMVIAAAAKIPIFATGGIGGVHRGAETDFDVSTDLTELGRTDVAVVCAGPKAILDIPATLEYLETIGVPVIGYRCDTVPAFWSQSSGIRLHCRLNSPPEIADLCQKKWQNGLAGGVLIVNPVPKKYEINNDEVETAIARALEWATEQKVRGKELTPFLLESIRQITGGASVKANNALVLNNAELAAEIATAIMH